MKNELQHTSCMYESAIKWLHMSLQTFEQGKKFAQYLSE